LKIFGQNRHNRQLTVLCYLLNLSKQAKRTEKQEHTKFNILLS